MLSSRIEHLLVTQLFDPNVSSQKSTLYQQAYLVLSLTASQTRDDAVAAGLVWVLHSLPTLRQCGHLAGRARLQLQPASVLENGLGMFRISIAPR